MFIDNIVWLSREQYRTGYLVATSLQTERNVRILFQFGYTSQDVSYNWTTGRGVNIASDMKLSQFDLIATPTGNETTERSKGTYSTLLVSFHLQRHMGDFVIQVRTQNILEDFHQL